MADLDRELQTRTSRRLIHDPDHDVGPVQTGEGSFRPAKKLRILFQHHQPEAKSVPCCACGTRPQDRRNPWSLKTRQIIRVPYPNWVAIRSMPNPAANNRQTSASSTGVR